MGFHRSMQLSFQTPRQGLHHGAYWWRMGSDGSLCEA
jgi:hypothetical protein